MSDIQLIINIPNGKTGSIWVTWQFRSIGFLNVKFDYNILLLPSRCDFSYPKKVFKLRFGISDSSSSRSVESFQAGLKWNIWCTCFQRKTIWMSRIDRSLRWWFSHDKNVRYSARTDFFNAKNRSSTIQISHQNLKNCHQQNTNNRYWHWCSISTVYKFL